MRARKHQWEKLLLTDRQEDVLDTVRSLIRKLNRPPTMREIAQAEEMNVSAVLSHLERISKKGGIHWEKGHSGTMRVARGMPVFGEVG